MAHCRQRVRFAATWREEFFEVPLSILNLRHTTVYRYRCPVALGNHRLMLRPRDSHDLRLIQTNLNLSPPATLEVDTIIGRIDEGIAHCLRSDLEGLSPYFYAPMIKGEGVALDSGWTELLANDYRNPRYHIIYLRAIGRRLRRTYAWIFVIQAIAYYGKLAIHPAPLTTLSEVWERAAIGPIPGGLVVLAGVLFHTGWAVFALVTLRIEIASRRERRSLIAMG
jgi:Predicted integral membrane protein (DUF2270)/Bacterial transglutaminase-like N-terminal region